jgi:hypothetical protein
MATSLDVFLGKDALWHLAAEFVAVQGVDVVAVPVSV